MIIVDRLFNTNRMMYFRVREEEELIKFIDSEHAVLVRETSAVTQESILHAQLLTHSCRVPAFCKAVGAG